MIENFHIAAQERQNNRYTPWDEPVTSVGCKECGEWDATKTYEDGLCVDCRIVNVFPTFQSSSVVPLTEYRVLTECDRTFVWSAFDLEHLMRDLIRKGYRAKHVQTLAEYEAEQERMRQLEQKNQLDLVRTVRARRAKERREGA